MSFQSSLDNLLVCVCVEQRKGVIKMVLLFSCEKCTHFHEPYNREQRKVEIKQFLLFCCTTLEVMKKCYLNISNVQTEL